VFLGPDGGHYRRSNYARRVFRPACDGRYDPSKLVIADATIWPGVPVTRWPPAAPGHPFTPPVGKGIARLVSSDDTGHLAALQARWEESLRERAAIVPCSPVRLLDGLLASHRQAALPPTTGASRS
jgi:hypothetical protein